MQKNSFSRKKASTRVTKALLVIIWLLIIAVLAAGGWYVVGQVRQMSESDLSPKSVSSFAPNVLVVVEDSGFSSVKPEFLLLRFDADNNEIKAVVLPDNMSATVNEYSGTMAEQFSYGGVLQAKAAVQGAFGITVHRYALLGEAVLEQFIDSMGGVSYTIDEKLYYEASDGTILTDLRAGEQTLTGEQVSEYFRYSNWSDSYRAANARAALAAAAINQYANEQDAAKLTGAFSEIANSLETDISIMDVDLLVQNVDKFTVLKQPASALSVAGSGGALDGETAQSIEESYK